MIWVYREVIEGTNEIYVRLLDGKKSVCTISNLADVIAREYCVNRDVLIDNEYVKKFAKKYNITETARDNIFIIINKDNKTAEELKREIKRVTRDLEQLIQTFIDKAKVLKEQQKLKEWLWKEARYDPEKRKFVKIVEAVDF